MTVKIVTDSVSDLPPDIIRELDITVIPLSVCFGNEVYRDGFDLTVREFFHKLKTSPVFPTTAVPPPAAFTDVYEKLSAQADDIVVITLSKKLSAFYEAALQSSKLSSGTAPITVIDSEWVIMAEGFIVMAAAEAARNGAKVREITDLVEHNKRRVELCSAFDTLEYLRRGGRINSIAAFMGNMMHIHPVIGVKDGAVVSYGKERSRQAAIEHLYRLAASYSRIEGLSIAYVDAHEDASNLIKRLDGIFPAERIIHSQTSPVIGTHTGPNMLVLALIGDK